MSVMACQDLIVTVTARPVHSVSFFSSEISLFDVTHQGKVVLESFLLSDAAQEDP